MWYLFAEAAYEELKKCETMSTEQKDDVGKLQKWIKSTFVNGRGHSSIVQIFSPIGRRDSIPEGVWHWLLAFDQTSSQGRSVHETTLELFDNFKLFGATLRSDRAPLDSIERALRATHLG